MDIAPTLTQLAGVQTSAPYDGMSLVPLMAAESTIPANFAHRVRFTETEYTPVGVATPDGKMSTSGIAEAAKMYSIDPETDHVEVRRIHLQPMLGIRQYAAIGDEYMLVALPFRSEGLSHHFVVLPKDWRQTAIAGVGADTRCPGRFAPRVERHANDLRRHRAFGRDPRERRRQNHCRSKWAGSDAERHKVTVRVVRRLPESGKCVKDLWQFKQICCARHWHLPCILLRRRLTPSISNYVC